jgi:hypothetical protein
MSIARLYEKINAILEEASASIPSATVWEIAGLLEEKGDAVELQVNVDSARKAAEYIAQHIHDMSAENAEYTVDIGGQKYTVKVNRAV